MKVLLRESFLKDVKHLKESHLRTLIKQTIEQVETVGTMMEIRNLKKLKSKGNYYRIRLSEYRIGLKIDNEVVIFIRCLNRKEIYRYFP
ncbi:MAG TPA: type II toxin-antitoxin system RelE/ParE family toxin [Bacteroidota bacterium]